MVQTKSSTWIRRARDLPGRLWPAPRNGDHFKKLEGDTIYRGPMERLPAPGPIENARAAAELMYSDGFVQIPDLLSAQEIDKLRQEMDQRGGPDAQYEMPGWCFSKHLLLDMQRDVTWLSLMDRSPAYEIIELILGPNFVLTGAGQWTTGRGRDMGMHVDALFLLTPEDRMQIFSCSVQFYLDDQVEEIGPTLVIPGSHCAGRWPRGESSWNGVQPKMVSVKAGGALLFRHDLWHGAAANTGASRRYLLQMHYARGWRKSLGAPITDAAYSPQVIERLTPRQRVLLGSEASNIFPG